jgi:multiple sugar transport system ATP-binding protein
VKRAGSDNLKAKVHVIEPIGPYDFVDIKVGDQILRAKTATRFVEKPGETIWFRIDEERVHFFDKRSGNSLNI